jgi:hypothetical protein
MNKDNTKRIMSVFACIALLISMCFLVSFVIDMRTEMHRKNNETVQKYMNSNGCTPTNEFVGKNAERLYLCSDGLKYKYGTLWSSALGK